MLDNSNLIISCGENPEVSCQSVGENSGKCSISECLNESCWSLI